MTVHVVLGLSILLLMPLTGIAVLLGDDDLLTVHVAAHLVFFAALAVHLWLVLRNGLLGRMY